ncbi:MAG: SigE family RNA polymerase sigma factor [Nocardioides sp.]|uniref:SigE family RNA polymerase sigma factor n=1 Tax=Nocardioides sp. TaxID=35761 RepID=UPI0039E57BA5
MTTGSDRRLMVQADKPADFEEFYRATWPRLYRTALAVAGDAATAEDALQAAYARAYASWRRVRSAEHPVAYVRRIVVHEVVSTRRRAWTRRERPSASPPEPADRAAPSTASPAEHKVTEHDAVWRAVLALPVRQRAIVVLRYYEELSEEEIAAVLGCARGTVKSQASAALANLRRHADLNIEDLT